MELNLLRNMKVNFKKFLIFILTFLFFFTSRAVAVNMRSNLYRIQFGNVNIGAQPQSSTNYDLSITLGQTAAGKFQSDGYVIKAGFQYIHSIIPFRFSISNTILDFGTLTPNNPKTVQTTLTVSFGGAGDYKVTVQEIGPLRTLDETSTIPDTTCDGGVNTCTESSAKPWTSNSAYGFGYNMTGDDIPTDFVDSTYYRPFPDKLANENPAIVMSSQNVGKNRQAVMTLKVNVSPVQPAGNYQTVLHFIATPSY